MNFFEDKIRVFLDKLKDVILIKDTKLEGFLYTETLYKPGDKLPAVDGKWKTFEEGQFWGGQKNKQYWFYNKFKTADETILKLRTGLYGQGWGAGNPQFLVWLNGEVVYGMDYFHTDIQISPNTEYEMYIYAYTNEAIKKLEFDAYISHIDIVAEKVYYDIKVPFDLCCYLDADEKLHMDIMKHLRNAVNIIDMRLPQSEEFRQSLLDASKYMEDEFYSKYGECSETTVVGVGHSHIDVAWLWTVAQTREKVLRTFSSVVSMMERYPEYKFMSSQAQLYEFVKEGSPELYEKIKELVRQGRWEIEGAMWLEADCNLSGGESLVRQVLFGKRFFKSEFDVDCKVLWLPDVFGYSAALPQILRKSGVDKFVTSKISWNETNTMPHDTFLWQGIDGTQILTYFLTAQDKVRGKKPERYANYTGMISPQQLAGTWERYQDKDISDEVLLTYGYGDGGGGPTREMLEIGRRLAKGVKGCPKFRFDSATSFLNKLKNRTDAIPNMPKWVGELYLEYHRGTYTSMAKNKRNNRKSEILYHNTELISCMDEVLNANEYPREKINQGWKKILLNQFHDIIPGSSIKEVYDVSDVDYLELQQSAEEILTNKYGHIADNINCQGTVVFNNAPFKRSDMVFVDGEAFYVEDVPANGYKVFELERQQNQIEISKNILENKFFRIRFSDGNIVSIYDKFNKREVIQEGKYANELLAFEDFPKDWDAWEITNYYEEKCWKLDNVVECETVDYGEKAGVKVTRKFLNSTIVQEICIYANIPRIDFDTYVDWHESHILLKAAFPIDMHVEKAVYDIQFGNVERPTHRNTSWDEAKFEVCAHKYADVSEDDWGVSLLNDCKYGYDINDSTMRLTLLKCATYPNPDADKCEHKFTYSLYPHKGNFKDGGTIEHAYALNNPLYAVKSKTSGGTLPNEYSVVSTDCDNIVIETIKKAEDNERYIIRLYDCFNRRSKPTIKFGFDVEEVYIADMMEGLLEKIPVHNDSVTVNVKPYEILTLSVKRRK